MSNTITRGFLAGFLSVLIFHQGMVFLMHHVGNGIPILVLIFGPQPDLPYNMTPVPPLHVPEVLAKAFWGGIWGIILAALLRELRMSELLFGFAFGALVLTMVGFDLIARLKGLPPLPSDDRQAWWSAGLCNGCWGLGTAALLQRLAERPGSLARWRAEAAARRKAEAAARQYGGAPQGPG